MARWRRAQRWSSRTATWSPVLSRQAHIRAYPSESGYECAGGRRTGQVRPTNGAHRIAATGHRDSQARGPRYHENYQTNPKPKSGTYCKSTRSEFRRGFFRKNEPKFRSAAPGRDAVAAQTRRRLSRGRNGKEEYNGSYDTDRKEVGQPRSTLVNPKKYFCMRFADTLFPMQDGARGKMEWSPLARGTTGMAMSWIKQITAVAAAPGRGIIRKTLGSAIRLVPATRADMVAAQPCLSRRRAAIFPTFYFSTFKF